jgi:hypothetical protein
MKKIIIMFFVLMCTLPTVKIQAQAKAVFFELGGPGLASFNYDMRFTKSENGIGGRIGFGGFSIGTGVDRATAIFVPLGINYLLGKDEKHYFELGGGATIVSTNDGSGGTFGSTFGHINFGYRLQPKDGGFFFRAAINPVFGKGFFIPYYAGLGFGYKF